MGIGRIASCLIALWGVLFIEGSSFADDQIYATEASFIGGAGGTATNDEYTLISSWRQPIQTSVSTGGEYQNVSGFLGAISDTSFRILSSGFTTNFLPSFQIAIPTIPGQTYAIQFTDGIGRSLPWQAFQNTNQAIGTYLETNNTPAIFTFTDDFNMGFPSFQFSVTAQMQVK